jgi:hypothetical protein
MNVRRGWGPFSVISRAWFINVLTRRMGFVCELTTAVYGPAATVSRVFCRYYILTKLFDIKTFGVIPRTEYA